MYIYRLKITFLITLEAFLLNFHVFRNWLRKYVFQTFWDPDIEQIHLKSLDSNVYVGSISIHLQLLFFYLYQIIFTNVFINYINFTWFFDEERSKGKIRLLEFHLENIFRISNNLEMFKYS